MIINQQTNFVVKHADTHSSSGTDAITPASIGALSSSFYAAASAPSDTRLLWIDTANSNTMKFYNGSTWVGVNAVWAE